MSFDVSDIVDDRLTGKTPLECAKKVELRMLRIFDRICKTYNLSYCLAYGTFVSVRYLRLLYAAVKTVGLEAF